MLTPGNLFNLYIIFASDINVSNLQLYSEQGHLYGNQFTIRSISFMGEKTSIDLETITWLQGKGLQGSSHLYPLGAVSSAKHLKSYLQNSWQNVICIYMDAYNVDHESYGSWLDNTSGQILFVHFSTHTNPLTLSSLSSHNAVTLHGDELQPSIPEPSSLPEEKIILNFKQSINSTRINFNVNIKSPYTFDMNQNSECHRQYPK